MKGTPNKSVGFLTMAMLMIGSLYLSAAEKPNVVIIFLDDSGYSDFSPFGKPPYKTPNVERLAESGVRLNRFHVPQAVCSASRAALMSGCYPGRTKVFGAHGPGGRGLETTFANLAEVLKKNGYATAHYGKWHIGDQEATRPYNRGFDEHAGLMYSHDMWRFHPKKPERYGRHPLSYWKNGKIVIKDVSKKDASNLTKWATEYSVDFIKRHKEKPFFLYLAHSLPHVPLFCSDRFKGKSGAGLYGDVIMEIDWSVGQVMDTLKACGIEKNTIVIFSSDNGPWAEYGNHAGKTPFREHKATGFDGGTRSATLVRYPEKIKGGTVVNTPVSSVDVLPTIVHLTGASLPGNPIDGKNAWPVISGQSSTPLHDYLPFSIGSKFCGVYSGDGKWKLHLPHSYRHVVTPGKDGMPGKTTKLTIELSLFNMEDDPKETTNVIDQHPEIAEELMRFAKAHEKTFNMSAAQLKNKKNQR